MFKLISLLLTILVFNTNNAYAEQKAVGMVSGACNSLEALQNIVEVDKKDFMAAKRLFYFYIQSKVCGILPRPLKLPLKKKEGEYKDSNGSNIQIWKIDHKDDFWTLIEDIYVKSDNSI